MKGILLDRISKTQGLKPTSSDDIEEWKKNSGFLESKYVDGDLMINYRSEQSFSSSLHFIGRSQKDSVYIEDGLKIGIYRDMDSFRDGVMSSKIEKGQPKSFVKLLKSAKHITFDGKEVVVDEVDGELDRLRVLDSDEKSDIYEFANGFYKEDLKRQKAYDENWDEFWLDLSIYRM